MNGHSDVMLGLLCGRAALWDRVPLALAAWGLASSPFDCWLASRGLATLPLRLERAAHNALQAAQFLSGQPQVERVDYPGLPAHPDHELAKRQFGGRYGSVAAFHLRGGRPAAEAFMAAARRIPFCPSLGEAPTTLSHPESTSHRGLSPEQRAELGIRGGTIRLSVGIESEEYVLAALEEGLRGCRA
jgi:cystathionine beta-lyase/cystathionine gamma-synthase